MLGGTAKEIGHAYLRFNVRARLSDLKTNHPESIEEALRRARIAPELIECIEKDTANLSQETLLQVLTCLNLAADLNLTVMAQKKDALATGQIC